MSTDLRPAEPFDMLAQARGPYRLTKDEFNSLPVDAKRQERRDAIHSLQDAIMAHDFTGTGFEKITEHHELAQATEILTPGVYVRVFKMHPGMRIIGKRHAQEHISIVSCGRATVMTEEGAQEIVGPCEFISPAGTKRVLKIHEYMVWTTVHRTDKTDLDEIMQELTIEEPGQGVIA